MTKLNTPTYKTSPQLLGVPISATLKINEAVAAKRATGESVYHMGFGESPFPVHPHIIDGLISGAHRNQYPPTAGKPELRAKAQAYFSKRLGFDADAYEAIVGPGSKDLIFAAQLAIEGDVLLPTPSWVSYAPQAQLAGNCAIKILTQVNNHHRINGDLISQTVKAARSQGRKPTKIILNYPNNPTGLGFDDHALQDIADACRKEGLIVISDEIYGLTNHGEPHKTIASYYPEGTIITTGLSKHLSLGGYRIGFSFVPKALDGLLKDMLAVASETWSCLSHPIQYVAIAALEENEDVERHITQSTKAHGLISNFARDQLLSLGLDYPPLAGAFYLYPDFSKFYQHLSSSYGVTSSEALADDLLSRLGVATLPGVEFGEEPNILTLRLAITDYDGAGALEYLESNKNPTPEQFAKACAPRVVEGFERIARYFSG